MHVRRTQPMGCISTGRFSFDKRISESENTINICTTKIIIESDNTIYVLLLLLAAESSEPLNNVMDGPLSVLGKLGYC